jgi:dynein heavy chain 1
VGAWGCFDEFNRLEEGILSAVSQHILSIQRGLQEQKDNISLLGVGETDQGCTIQTKNRLGGPGSSSRREASISVSESGFVSMVQLNPNVGIFITMNPSYAGRSQLPDNLKYLFRAVAMVKPDLKLIAQVMLFNQPKNSP